MNEWDVQVTGEVDPVQCEASRRRRRASTELGPFRSRVPHCSERRRDNFTNSASLYPPSFCFFLRYIAHYDEH
jgi:hypothetical protein